MKKEDIDADPQSMDNRRLGAIARNPNHPLHTHAKSELDRRRMAREEKDPEEYDKEGSMMKGQLRQICSANEKLMSMVKDDDNLPEWVQSKVTKATDYIRSVRDYLESEKKVNEVSLNTLRNYMRKSAADAGKPRQSARTQDKRIGGQKMADDKLRKMQGKGSAAKVAATEADDATVRMYKDNPDMMKSKGPGGLKSLSKKAQKDVKKSMNEAATPAMKKAADELNSYAKKHGGIDKADFMKASKMLSSGKAGMALIKFVDGQDTDVYEKIIRVMAKHMGKQTVEKMFKVNIREANTYVGQRDQMKITDRKPHPDGGHIVTLQTKAGKTIKRHIKNGKVKDINELSKDTMQSYWDKTKGDDAFSGSRKANNRLKGAINVTTKLDKLKKMVKR